MPHKSEDFKISAVEYYLDSNKTQEEVCNIFKCSLSKNQRFFDKVGDNFPKGKLCTFC
jgi:transposase-like protein